MSAVVAARSPDRRAAAARELLDRRAARRDLLRFTERTHPSWVTGDHHHEICAQLMRLARGEIHFLAIFAPPRHSKSELVSRRFPAWYLGHHPNRQVLSASAVDALSTDLGADVRNLVQDASYQAVFPGVTMRPDTRAKGRWHTTAGGIYYAVSVGGTCVGRGAHLGIIDDPHKGRNKAASVLDREKIHSWYAGEFRQRLMRPHSVLLTLTRWHEDDLAGRLLGEPKTWKFLGGHLWEAGQWTVLKLQAIEHEGDPELESALWPGEEAPSEATGLLAGYPLPYLRELRAELVGGGKARDWYAQYQQEPAAETGTYIQREWFRRTYDPDHAHDDRCPVPCRQEHEHTEACPGPCPAGPPDDLHVYMASDIAVTDPDKDVGGVNRDPDWTEHAVYGFGSDRLLYVLNWWSGRTESDRWVEALLDAFERYRPLCWFTTKGVIQRAVNPILKRRMRERGTFCRVEYLPDDKDKAVKGRSFQAFASAGRVVFPSRRGWAQQVIDQCVAFPGARHDDKFDNVSNMCRAIDLAHPAIARRAAPPPKRTTTWRDVDGRPALGGRWRAA